MGARLTFHLNISKDPRRQEYLHSERLARGGVATSMDRMDLVNCKVCLRKMKAMSIGSVASDHESRE